MRPNGKKKPRKVELVFDSKKRKEFLTGFRKRKQERRRKAKEEIELQLKEERKRIRDEMRGGIREQLKMTSRSIPELDEFLNEENYEDDDVTVKIVELNAENIAKSNNWIGSNFQTKSVEIEDKSVNDNEGSESDESMNIKGMELNDKKQKKNLKTDTKANDNGQEETKDDESCVQKTAKPKLNLGKIKTKRGLTQTVQKQCLKSLRRSTAFKASIKMKSTKDKKKARREKKTNELISKKSKAKKQKRSRK